MFLWTSSFLVVQYIILFYISVYLYCWFLYFLRVPCRLMTSQRLLLHLKRILLNSPQVKLARCLSSLGSGRTLSPCSMNLRSFFSCYFYNIISNVLFVLFSSLPIPGGFLKWSAMVSLWSLVSMVIIDFIIIIQLINLSKQLPNCIIKTLAFIKTFFIPST